MAKSAKIYFEEMCKEAGLSAEETQAALAFTSNEKLASRLDSLVKTGTEDYQAQLGRVQAAERKVKEFGDWYGTANTQYQQMADELATAKAQLTGRSVTDPNLFDTSKFLTKEDLNKVVQEQGTRFASVLKSATTIAARHAATFGEAPDMEAIDKIAQENNLPLQTAYEQYIRPRIEAKQNADFEAKLKAARDEGAKDYASRHRMPADPVPVENSYINPRGPKPEPVKDIDSELMAAWNGAEKAA